MLRPVSRVCCATRPESPARNVEVGVVGREGLVGLPALLGAERAVTKAMVQMEGSA
jgi:hypothetical protein